MFAATTTAALVALEASRILPTSADPELDRSPVFAATPQTQPRSRFGAEDEEQPRLSNGLRLTPEHDRVQIVLDRQGVTFRLRLAR